METSRKASGVIGFQEKGDVIFKSGARNSCTLGSIWAINASGFHDNERVSVGLKPMGRIGPGQMGVTNPFMFAKICFVLRVVFRLMIVVGLVLPVGAQGQTPDTPIQRPAIGQGSSLTGTTQSTQQLQQLQRLQQQQQQQQQLGGSTQTGSQSAQTGRFSARDTGTSRSGATQQGTRQGQTPGAVQPGGATDPLAPPATRGGGVGGMGTSVVGGGGRGAGGGGTTMKVGAGGAISVLGGGEAFEPAFDREIVYGDVPEEGDQITFLEGPMPLTEFMQTINLATNWTILISEEAQTFQLPFFVIVEKSPREAMETLKFHKVFYEFDPHTKYLYIMTATEWLDREFAKAQPHEFLVQNADVTYIESVLASLLSSRGRVISDQRTGHIFVWDTRDNLDQMIKTVDMLDVPLEKREFMVHYADLGDIEGVLNTMLSPNGSILADARTGQIFVWDNPSKLDQIQLAVNRLDVPVESQTFQIQYVNAEDIVDSIEVLMSERGLIQVDPRYNTIVITDLPARVEKMAEMIATIDRELETRTWIIKYADIDFVAETIETLIPPEMGEIIVNEDVHQITITGLPSRLDQVDALISTWDVKRRQVLIEAYIVEVGVDVEHQFNVNWSYFDSKGSAPIAIHTGSGFSTIATPSGSGETMSVGQLPYSIPAYGNLELDSAGNVVRPILENIMGDQVIDGYAGNRLAVTLNYLDKQNKASILSSPRVVVQDGEEAVFENATRVPYVSASTYFGGYTSDISRVNNTNRVEFIDVGTILRVYPQISEDNNILLDVSAEDSTFRDKVIVANDQESTVPEKTVRRAETQLRIASGETVVLGGLRRDRSSKATTRTPFLGDLPVVGRLFRNPIKSAQANTLLIFITTTVVDEFTHPETTELTRAIESVGKDVRHNTKSLWGRVSDNIAKGKREIGVSIGQSGALHSEGQRVTLEELREAFFSVNLPASVTVIIRQHPRAPAEIVSEVTEAAMEANLKVDFDYNIVPFVPVDTARIRAELEESAANQPGQTTMQVVWPQQDREASATALSP
jgi:general secretion pathway protein D